MFMHIINGTIINKLYIKANYSVFQNIKNLLFGLIDGRLFYKGRHTDVT